MFRRSRSGRGRTRRARSAHSSSLRSRTPLFEQLEDRRLLAVVTVTNNNDVINGTVTSIANLIATPGADGISLREALAAANNTANAPAGTPDEIHFAIPGAGPHTIAINAIQGALVISDSVVIDGFTETLDGASSPMNRDRKSVV